MTLHLECYVVVSSWNTGMAVSRNAGCQVATWLRPVRGRLERACEPFRNIVDLGRVRAVGVIHARGRIGGLSCQSTVHGRAS